MVKTEKCSECGEEELKSMIGIDGRCHRCLGRERIKNDKGNEFGKLIGIYKGQEVRQLERGHHIYKFIDGELFMRGTTKKWEEEYYNNQKEVRRSKK